MSELVGQIYYQVEFQTSGMISGQRRVEAALKSTSDKLGGFEGKLTKTAQAARVHAQATEAAAVASKKAEAASAALAVASTKVTQAHKTAAAASKASTAATEATTKAGINAAAAGKKVSNQGAKTAASMEKTAMSAKAMSAATRNIPAQFTDIVTSLQGGQSPLTVLLQQGGQLKDMFGGIGPAAKALGGYVVGLISPLAVGAAAVGTFFVGLVKGQQEMSDFTKTLELGGNKAGVTSDQLNTLAAGMDSMAGVTRGKAAEALTIFAAAGLSGEKNIAKFTAAAIKLEQAGGPAIEDTAKAFSALGAAPLQAAVQLNGSVNFLTESLYRQIKSLQQQGKLTEAAKVAQNAYADAINNRTPKIMENLGLMERGWRAVANGAKSAWDAILNIGRAETSGDAIETTRKKIAALQAQIDSGGFSTTAGGAAVGSGLSPQAITQKKAELEALKEQVRQYARAQSAAEGAAAADAKRAKTVQAIADFDQAGEKFLTQRAQMEREITQARNMGLEAGKSEAEIQKRIADIRRNYSGLDAKSDGAQAYYQGLVAENAIALAKIDAAEKKELADNQGRMTQDWENAGIYQRARVEITRKYAKERAVLEEKTTQEVADLAIAITSDESRRIQLIRDETFRRADAGVRLNVITHAQGEREKKRATFESEREQAALRERIAQTNADTAIQATVDELTRIEMIRKEAHRRADAAGKAGLNPEQVAADKNRANGEATGAINAQLISIDPVAQLEKEYQSKLAIVQRYQELIGSQEVGGAQMVADKKAEIDRAYQLQRQQLAEQAFVAQSAGNAFLIGSLNSLSNTAASSITGLVTGTMNAADAMKALGTVVMNEAVGSLVQIGMQYLKNAVISEAADKAQFASKAASGTMYAASVAAQVAGTSALAAQATFASISAIPVIGPGLAPAAAAAAGATAMALGSPAVATASIAGARQYGGPTDAGKMYRVNETGAPEMFTAANGNQFMLGGQSGNVTPADGVGGGGISITQSFHFDSTTDKAAALAQMQRVTAESNKQMIEQLKRMKVLPQ